MVEKPYSTAIQIIYTTHPDIIYYGTHVILFFFFGNIWPTVSRTDGIKKTDVKPRSRIRKKRNRTEAAEILNNYRNIT